MENFRILIIDDDRDMARSLREFLERRSYSVWTAASGEEGLSQVGVRSFDAALLDIHLPGADGIEVLGLIKKQVPDLPVVMMTAYASIDTAVSALRLGATDYIIKPFEPDEMFSILGRLAERKELIDANQEFIRAAKSDYDFDHIVTKDPGFREILEAVKKIANTDVPALIMGESGTGKELVARALHNNSARAARPLIAVNCAAISPTLIESEFFGHVKGSFTGAVGDAKGYIERADKSTLFLDEIGELPPELQAKLLRAIQEGQICRVGESRPISVDVRYVAATQRDLEKEVEEGRFRKDLYFRLNLFTAKLPALRTRPADIPLLAEYFLDGSTRRGMSIAPQAMERLMNYKWPGNARELENVIQRSSILAKDKVITVSDLPFHADRDRSGYAAFFPADAWDYKEVVKNVTDVTAHDLISRALLVNNGNVSAAARFLGVSRRFLNYRIKELAIRGAKSDAGEEE